MPPLVHIHFKPEGLPDTIAVERILDSLVAKLPDVICQYVNPETEPVARIKKEDVQIQSAPKGPWDILPAAVCITIEARLYRSTTDCAKAVASLVASIDPNLQGRDKLLVRVQDVGKSAVCYQFET